MTSGRGVITDGVWIKDGCHTLSIEGLYDYQSHSFINGGMMKAYQNGTIDLSGSDPNCQECLFQFWKLRNPHDQSHRNIYCIQSYAYKHQYLYWDDVHKPWTVHLLKVDDAHEKDKALRIRWVLVMDPIDQRKKLLQAWDEIHPHASPKYLVFNVVSEEVKLESDRDNSSTFLKITADLLTCRDCAEKNAAIKLTDNDDIDTDK